MFVELGTKVYYTGDMANVHGWFEVVACNKGHCTLQEIDGDRTLSVQQRQIGTVYQGHCDPRFVTETAYLNYKKSRQ